MNNQNLVEIREFTVLKLCLAFARGDQSFGRNIFFDRLKSLSETDSVLVYFHHLNRTFGLFHDIDEPQVQSSFGFHNRLEGISHALYFLIHQLNQQGFARHFLRNFTLVLIRKIIQI